VFELNVKLALLFGPKSPVAAVKNATKQVSSVASLATVIAVGVPPPAAAQLKFPLPSVFKNWPASPSFAGKVIVQVPAASAVLIVTVPLVIPLSSIEPVAVPATPTVSF